MYKQLLPILLIVAFCGKDVLCNGHEVKKNTHSRISGGSKVSSIQQYPYLAYLSMFNGTKYSQCGGAIVSKDFIITAAHCLRGKKTITVRIGSTISNSGGKTYEAVSFYPHPLYSSSTNDYDVGVVQVDGMDLDGKNASVISMVELGSDVSEGEQVLVSGWGLTGGNSTKPSKTLMATSVFVVDRDRCNKMFGGDITTRMFCAGTPSGVRSSCQGDSGSPVVRNNTVVGVTSYGGSLDCGNSSKPTVYALLGDVNVRSFIKMKTGLA